MISEVPLKLCKFWNYLRTVKATWTLPKNLPLQATEAKKSFIKVTLEQYSTIKEYMDKASWKHVEKGYVETIMKRRRYLPDINSANAVVRGFVERNAINAHSGICR